MSALTRAEIAKIEWYCNSVGKGLGGLQAALDPVGVAIILRVVRDVLGVIGYAVEWQQEQRRYCVLATEEGGKDDN